MVTISTVVTIRRAIVTIRRWNNYYWWSVNYGWWRRVPHRETWKRNAYPNMKVNTSRLRFS